MGRGAMPGATGVFAARERPTDGNVMAARFLLALARAEGPAGAPWRDAATVTLAVMLGDARVTAQGRFVGELLLALDVTSPDGATVTLRRDAAALTDDRARFVARVDVPLAARVTLRYALCGSDRCEPQERVAVLGRDGPAPRP